MASRLDLLRCRRPHPTLGQTAGAGFDGWATSAARFPRKNDQASGPFA